jgi:Spy/CpxP family protein refolding chaperone
MKRTFLITSAAAIAIVAVASFTALAHGPNNGQWMGGGMMGMMGGNGHMGQYTQVKPATLEELEKKLELTDKQKPAWEAYVNTVKDVEENFTALHESMDPQAMHEMTLEDRRIFMQSVWESRNEDSKALQAAQSKLFEVLTPEQTKTLKSTQTFAGMPCDASGWQGHGRMMNNTSYMMGPGMGFQR